MHTYSATGTRVYFTPSKDDIAVRLKPSAPGHGAVRAARGLDAEVPGAFEQVMWVKESGAARDVEGTVRDALPQWYRSRVADTLPVLVENRSGLHVVATDEITVRFRSGTRDRKRRGVLSALGLEPVRLNEFQAQQMIVRPVEGGDVEHVVAVANSLFEAGDVVEFAAPNFLSEHRKGASDPLLLRQWHLHNGDAGGADLRADEAWSASGGGAPGIVVAVVDDGVDIEHPDLAGHRWRHPNPDALDQFGRNFYDDNFDPRPRYFQPPYDQLSGNDIHGTPCAGLIAANSPNRLGLTGIAYSCRILPIKIFGADDLAPNDRVADAIRYAGQHAGVISCSWHGPWSADLEQAIRDVTTAGRDGRGCLAFFASGNSGENQIPFPARLDEAMAVGAANDRDERSTYSNHGAGLDFVAPSSDPARGRPGIATTDVSKPGRGFNPDKTHTTGFGGTSAATPLAAGVGALMLSVCPNLTWKEARTILRATAVKIDQGGGSGPSAGVGFGRIDAAAAVERAARHPGC